MDQLLNSLLFNKLYILITIINKTFVKLILNSRKTVQVCIIYSKRPSS